MDYKNKLKTLEGSSKRSEGDNFEATRKSLNLGLRVNNVAQNNQV